MSTPFCRVERDGHIVTITMNRPEKLNAMNAEHCFEMDRVLSEFDADDDLWVAIITGAGEKSFTAGHDLLDNPDAPMPHTGYGGLAERRNTLKPIIAAVNGFALGGGFGMALACDIIVASDNAEFGVVQPRIGGLGLGGEVARLARQIPYHLAMGIVLTGRRVRADEAYRLGIVNEVVPQGQAMIAARRWAEEILQCGPIAVRLHKQIAIESSQGASFTDMIERHRLQLTPVEFATEDLKEGIRAFAEKRKPVWQGR